MKRTPRPTLVCLTPIKDEAWILDSFLRAASLWADHIVIADQGSSDNSREIAARFPKVHLVDNPSPIFDELERQRLLLDEARRLVDGPRILLALDADEALSSNLLDQPAWDRVLSAEPGTVIRFPLVNLAPAGAFAWMPAGLYPFGFVDDGSDHHGERIHTPRIPVDPDAPHLVLPDCAMLHRQFLDWERMKAKQRWYQCWEAIHSPGKSALWTYRQYHHMDAVPEEQRRPLREDWLRRYVEADIDLLRVEPEPVTHWDADTLDLLERHGHDRFRRLAIWDVQWAERARVLGRPVPPGLNGDPRSRLERVTHRWLRRTQGRSPLDREVYWGERLLRALGW